MKKWKQLLMVAVLTLCFGLVYKADAKAAAISNVKQAKATQNSVTVSCDADLASGGYCLEISTDKEQWIFKNASDDPNNLTAEGLSAGKSYYARVTGYSFAEYDWFEEKWNFGTITAATSEPIEVVTVPDVKDIAAVQAGATTTGFSVAFQNVADTGANYFRLISEGEIWGEGDSTIVDTTKTLAAGSEYWLFCHACRKSAEGFVAMDEYSSYAYCLFKTSMNALNKNNFGVTNAWTNINTYDFAVNDSTSARDGIHFQFATVAGKVKKDEYVGGDSVSLSNFIQGTFYMYRVRSYVNCGSDRAYSAWSGYKTIAYPKTVTGKSSGKALKVNWSSVSGASGYTIYVSAKENSGYKKFKSLNAKTRSVSIKKVAGKKIKKGKTYYIRIVPTAKINNKTVSAEKYGSYSFKY